MNKDLNPAYELKAVESFLELPLDGDAVAGIDKDAGTTYGRTFKIKSLTQTANSEIQAIASRVAASKGLHRYELDIIYWNRQ